MSRRSAWGVLSGCSAAWALSTWIVTGGIAHAQSVPAAEPPADPQPAAASAAPTASEPAPEAGAEPQPVPVPAPVEAPAAEAPATDVAAELAALKAEVDALKAKAEEAELAALSAEVPAETDLTPELLRVYGFMDFGLDKFFYNSPNDDGIGLLRPTSATTFVFGNLNLYFDAHPIEHLRSLVEIRFTLAPHGEETQLGPPLGTSYQRIDTVAFDYSSPSSQAQLRLGGIYIERAWTEYQFSELFKLQWGMYLNPFGIWNLDHGSPTLISLILPTFIASQMVPGRLLGVNLYGSKFLGPTEIGYALHISNGRGPIDFDLSEDKAIGARFFVANEGDYGRLVLGTSGYIGTYLDQEKTINPKPNGDVFDWTDTVSYTEEVLGVDAALDLGSFRLRSEGVLRWVTYHDGLSERIFTNDGSEQYLPNRLEWDVYGIFAYRTPWRVEPYVQLELSHKSYVLPRFAGSSRATTNDVTPLSASVGFNIELTTHTLFKTQLAWIRAYKSDLKDYTLTIPYLFVRVVNSF
jgi:hypothetical protein